VALPDNLLESELFGYEKGASPGLNACEGGLLEYADGGTLFLDEICELAPNLQAKLLRVLQEREFRRVGGKTLIKVDLRIISATNKYPLDAVKSGYLRQDLYYRLECHSLGIATVEKPERRYPSVGRPLFTAFLKISQDKKKRNPGISAQCPRRLFMAWKCA